jgi:hypothetical protein
MNHNFSSMLKLVVTSKIIPQFTSQHTVITKAQMSSAYSAWFSLEKSLILFLMYADETFFQL